MKVGSFSTSSAFRPGGGLRFVLVAVLVHVRRLGFLPIFSKKTKQRKAPEKSRLFRGKNLKKLETFLFPAFSRLVRYKYYSRKLFHFISKTIPQNIRVFMRKGGTFLRFSWWRVKVKKRVFLFLVLSVKYEETPWFLGIFHFHNPRFL